MSPTHTPDKKPRTPITLRLHPMHGSKRAADFQAYARTRMGNLLNTSGYSPYLNVYVRGTDQELDLFLHIEPHTREQDIKDALPLVMDLRDLLLEFQGLPPIYFEPWILEPLLQQKANGATYTQLAHQIEDLIHGLLLDTAGGSYDAWQELEWNCFELHIPFTGTYAQLTQYLREAVATTRRTGEPPHIQVTPEELKDRLRNWTKSKPRKHMITWWDNNSPDPPPDPMDDETSI
jgi:hypothetical protein